MSTDHELSGAHGDQLQLLADGPMAGEQYQNIHTGSIGVVVSVVQRRQQWVILRTGGRLTEVPAKWLSEHYERWRPPTSVL